MSAICGVLHPDDRPVSRQRIEAMSRRAVLLRPDLEGIWCRGPLGLAARQRRTGASDALPNQPLIADGGALALVFDGRIDHRQRLLAELPEPPEDSVSDAALVLACYRARGIDGLARIAGDFAFALWDEAERRLVCVRDAVGVRKLFYRDDEPGFRFASQLQQLVEEGETPAFDEEFFGLYMMDGIPPLAASPYRGVHKLPPGHRLVVEDGRVHLQRYWRPEERPKILYRDDAEYSEHFRDAFRRAVRSQLRADGPVWCELSGGLDSSSVTAMAQEVMRAGEAPDHGFGTLTMIFDDTGPGDPPEFRRSVVEKYGLSEHTVVADESDVFGELEAATPFWDEPHHQIRFYSFFRRYDAVLEQAGVRALLAGNGAEVAVLSEYPPPLHLAELLRRLRLRQVYREASRWQRALRVPLANTLWTWAIYPLLKPPNRSYAFERHEAPAWIAPSFAKRLDLEERANRGWLPRVFDHPGDQWQYEKLGRGAEVLYRGYMEHGCEMRYPFYDRPLLEDCLAMPYERMLVPGQFKLLLRRAMEGILPENVRRRPDKGSIGTWVIRSLERQWPRLDPLLRSSVLAELGFADGDELHRAVHLFCYGRAKRTALLSAIVTLELWVRRALRRPPFA